MTTSRPTTKTISPVEFFDLVPAAPMSPGPRSGCQCASVTAGFAPVGLFAGRTVPPKKSSAVAVAVVGIVLRPGTDSVAIRPLGVIQVVYPL